MVNYPSDYNPIVRQYEEDVLSGKIVSGRLLKMAIERHHKDLKDGHERNLYFDTDAAQEILDFCRSVYLSPGKRFRPLPWQQWELYVFYGWRRIMQPDELQAPDYDDDNEEEQDASPFQEWENEAGQVVRRRFRRKYKSCGRGNGKTPLEAVQIAYHLLIDGPYKGEAYVCANKEKQAKICFDDVKGILQNSPELWSHFQVRAERITCLGREAFFDFLTSNPTTADGSRPTYAVVDEYHEFEKDDMIGVLSSGLIKKPNTILSIITTRGFHQQYPCAVYERKVIIPLLEGSIQNDDMFAVVYSLDDEKELDDPKMWPKPNPMMCPGGIISLPILLSEQKESVQKGEEAMINFKTKNLNFWCNAPQTFISEKLWLASGEPFKPEDVAGHQAWAGLDMGMTDDFCAFSLYFPPQDWEDYDDWRERDQKEQEEMLYVRSPMRTKGLHRWLWWYWIPEASVEKRVSDGLVSLRDWEKSEHIRLLKGNVIDPSVIESDIVKIMHEYNIAKMHYDRFNAVSTVVSLENKGMAVEQFIQMPFYYNEPTKAYRDLVLQGRLSHNNNPVTSWMMRNARPHYDSNGNMKITKDSKQSPDKVDGVQAAIMALAAFMSDRETSGNRSQYETYEFTM